LATVARRPELGCCRFGRHGPSFFSFLERHRTEIAVWLENARGFGEFNRVYAEFFPGKRPARSTTRAKLVVDTKVEIEVIAYKP